MPDLNKLSSALSQDEARSSCVSGSAWTVDLTTPASNDAAPSSVQKKRNKSRRVSLLADRHFLNEHKALTGITVGIAPVQCGVSAIVGVGKGYQTSDPLPSYITKSPRHWRDATDETQAHFAMEALLARGPVVAFTAWTSQEISDRAYATGKPLAFLRKRVVEALGAAFGQVELLASIEEALTNRAGVRKLRLHLHGALNLDNPSRRRLALLRQVLRRAMGPWDGKALKAQVKLRLDVDTGWASYCTKHSWLALPGIRKRFACARPGSMFRLSFDGDVLTMTNGIRARAKELHQQAREAVQEARQRPAAPETTKTDTAPSESASGSVKPAPTMWIWGARIYTTPTLATLAGQFRPLATARSRGPPKPATGVRSAGADFLRLRHSAQVESGQREATLAPSRRFATR